MGTLVNCTLPCVGWDEYKGLRDASVCLTKGREHGGTKQDAPRSATYDALCSTATDRGAELESLGHKAYVSQLCEACRGATQH